MQKAFSVFFFLFFSAVNSYSTHFPMLKLCKFFEGSSLWQQQVTYAQVVHARSAFLLCRKMPPENFRDFNRMLKQGAKDARIFLAAEFPLGVYNAVMDGVEANHSADSGVHAKNLKMIRGNLAACRYIVRAMEYYINEVQS